MYEYEILKHLPRHWKKDIGSNVQKIVHTIGDEMDEVLLESNEVLMQAYVQHADMNHLIKIGALIDVPPRPDETEDQYRHRLLAHVQGYIGGGTKSQIEKAISWYVGEDNFRLVDGFTYNHPEDGVERYGIFRFFLDMPEAVEEMEGPLDYDWVMSQLHRYKAAGVMIDFGGILLKENLTLTDNLTSFEPSLSNHIQFEEDEYIYVHRVGYTTIDSGNVIK